MIFLADFDLVANAKLIDKGSSATTKRLLFPNISTVSWTTPSWLFSSGIMPYFAFLVSIELNTALIEFNAK